MKSNYYVNKIAQSNGDHEIHKETCFYFPSSQNRQYLGAFESCQDAVKESKKTYSTTNGCIHCSPTCHTS